MDRRRVQHHAAVPTSSSILHHLSGTTTARPLGEYLKGLLTGQNLPSDLAAEAAFSPLMAQYDPARPLSLARPGALPDSDLTDAFTPDAD